jgi:cytochrome c oxidase cbb3-type subunit 3
MSQARLRGIGLFTALAALVAAGFVLAAEGPDGKALYEAKCAMCHGKDGVAKPTAKGSPNFNDPKWQEATSAEAIVKVVNEGKGAKKALKDKLTAEELAAIAAHVKTLK